jgi:hypothetical protein
MCPWCHKELVEVDNPFRREVRHRRGEEVQCPGPPGGYEPRLEPPPQATRTRPVERGEPRQVGWWAEADGWLHGHDRSHAEMGRCLPVYVFDGEGTP